MRADDENVSQALISWVRSFPTEWQKKLADELKDKADEENPGTFLDDGTPFLSSPSNAEFDDDIPF